MQSIEIAASARSNAAPSDVFALLKDGSTWPRWSMFSSFELERAGEPDPLGVGAIRVFVSPGRRAREEVIGIEEGRQFSYVLRSGMPFRDYRADVRLCPASTGGTKISWQARFDVQSYGTGWFWRLVMRRVLGSTARKLAKAAADPTILDAARANIAMSQNAPPSRRRPEPES